MPLDFPTFSEIANRQRADIKAQLTDSDPYLPDSMLNIIAVSNAGRINELYDQLLIIKDDSLATTASDTGLEDIGAVYGLSLNPATQASGNVMFVGTATTAIAAATNIQSSGGENYKTQAGGTIAAQTVAISSLTRSGSTVTATAEAAHNLGTGMTVTISGANQTDYNGAQTITVTSTTIFQYTIDATPATPATGTIIGSYDGLLLEVLADNTGQDTNVTGGATLTLTTPISGVENTVFTTFTGLDGGANIETYEAFRVRLLTRIQNPLTPYNSTNIILTAKTVSGVTRVWVYEPDDATTSVTPSGITVVVAGYPKITFSAVHGLLDGMEVTVSGANQSAFNVTAQVIIVSTTEVVYYAAGTTGAATGTLVVAYSNIQLGQTRILFVRDNDSSIIPSATEIATVKTALLAIKPANTSDNDLVVEAPSLNSVAFTFTALSPDTPEMQDSIEENLTNLFTNTDIGTDITEQQYLTAIQNSYDTAAGNGLTSFTLSTPSGDISVDYNDISVLGTMTYP